MVYTVSKGGEKEGYKKGYITKELLKNVLPKEDTEKRVNVLVCGPPGLEESVAGKRDSRDSRASVPLMEY